MTTQIACSSSFSAASEEGLLDPQRQMLSSAQENVRRALQGKCNGYEELLSFRETTQNQGYKELPLALFTYSAATREWKAFLCLSESCKIREFL